MVAITFTGHWTGAKTIPEQKVIVFKKIREGIKCTTIRERARCKPGDQLQLYWHMRQRDCEKILDTVCREVAPILIYENYIILNGVKIQDPSELHYLAVRDGFRDYDSFLKYFTEGLLYHWIKWTPPTMRQLEGFL